MISSGEMRSRPHSPSGERRMSTPDLYEAFDQSVQRHLTELPDIAARVSDPFVDEPGPVQTTRPAHFSSRYPSMESVAA